MALVSFESLGNLDFNFSHMFLLEQHWDNGEIYSFMGNPRATYGLFLVQKDIMTYTLKDGSTITAKNGDIVFLPMKSEYIAKFSCKTDSSTALLMNFLLTDQNGELIEFSDNFKILIKTSPPFLHKKFRELYDLYNNSIGLTPKFKIALYDFFSELVTMQISTSDISAGLDYIHNNLSSDISVSHLAKISALSETTFRTKFKKQMGFSPNIYINRAKIEKSKELLLSGTLTTDEISEILNFYDATYFCKTFKKITGVTTKEFKALYNKL